jgi:uncharacterized protein YkwD
MGRARLTAARSVRDLMSRRRLVSTVLVAWVIGALAGACIVIATDDGDASLAVSSVDESERRDRAPRRATTSTSTPTSTTIATTTTAVPAPTVAPAPASTTAPRATVPRRTTPPATAPPATAAPITTPPPPAASCNPGSGAGPAGEIAARFCSHRNARGLPGMTRNSRLDAEAAAWARHLAATNLPGHNPSSSALTLGICLACVLTGENVAWSVPASVDFAWSFWLGSPDHRANVDRARPGEFGVGAALAADGQTMYFVQMFGWY